VADTVRISMPPPAERHSEIDEAEKEQQLQEAAEIERLAREAEESAREAKEAKVASAWFQCARNLEDAWARAGVEHWQQEQREKAEQREREAAELRELEEAERLAAIEAANRAAEQETQRKAEEAEKERTSARKAAVDSFLKQRGFKGVTAPKRTLMKTTYALHEAAKLGDAEMVRMLVEEGADIAQKNSRGKTALQRAQVQDKAGSHKDVISVLGSCAGHTDAAVAATVGGA
jgi:hypothetical protein